MAWTTPKTWASEPLTSTDLNTHVRDNLNALKNPANAEYVVQGAAYSTTSISWVDVDSVNLSLTITTNGGAVLALATGTGDIGGTSPDSGAVAFTFLVDGITNVGYASNGLGWFDLYATSGVASAGTGFAISKRIAGLSAGSHTFKLRYKIDNAARIAYVKGVVMTIIETG